MKEEKNSEVPNKQEIFNKKNYSECYWGKCIFIISPKKSQKTINFLFSWLSMPAFYSLFYFLIRRWKEGCSSSWFQMPRLSGFSGEHVSYHINCNNFQFALRLLRCANWCIRIEPKSTSPSRRLQSSFITFSSRSPIDFQANKCAFLLTAFT